MSYQYGQEARDRISALGLFKIADFIDEIPVGLRKPFYDRQPAIPGFRQGTLPEFKKKQERLINHLVHPQGGAKGESDWKLFASFWVAWAISRVDVAFPKNDEPSFLPDAGAAFLTHLSEQFPDISRETVERLFCFSGFSHCADTLAAIDRFHPASTLARDRMIDSLPGRLDKIEGHIEIAEPAAEEAAKRIDQLESDLVDLGKAVDQATADISQASQETGQLRSAVDQVTVSAEKLEGLVLSLVDSVKQNSGEISAFDNRIESFKRILEALSEKVKEEGVTISSEIIALREMIYQVRKHEPIWREITDTIEKVVSRVDSLELSISKTSGGRPTKPEARIFETESPGPFIDISDPEAACEMIAWNLQACGVVKGNAIVTARQILAALTTGQIVHFTGSIADLVVEYIAAAVGGPVFHEWQVPVGLVSDEVASEYFEALGETSGCLVLKGANRSAFEVYGTAIRDVVVSRQYTSSDYNHLALITSWAQGPATFPEGGVLAELGPVFDTDSFRMRGGLADLPAPKFGHLVRGTWLYKLDVDSSTISSLIKDFKDNLRNAGFSPGNLWMRSAERALVRLRTLPGVSEEQDLHDFLTLWALPWARAIEGPTEGLGQLAAKVLTAASYDLAPPEGI